MFEYLAFGKLVIFFGQKVVSDNISKENFLVKLIRCDLCLGFWIYFFLGFVFSDNILFEELNIGVPIVREVLLAMASTLFVHLLTLGWHTKWREIVIEVSE
jgi:hypothetical protein